MSQLDRKILAIVLVVTLVSGAGVLAFRYFAARGERAVIEVENRVVQTVTLTPGAEPREVTIQGVLGESLIGVDGEHIYMIDSACPDKVCVQMGRKSLSGEVIVCLPNRVVIRILGVPVLP